MDEYPQIPTYRPAISLGEAIVFPAIYIMSTVRTTSYSIIYSS
jgi:hypothetical protein